MTPSRPNYFSEFSTPLGMFSVAVNAQGSLTAAAFGNHRALQRRIGAVSLVRDPARTSPARRQVKEWLRGARRAFTLPVSPAGSSFQRRVWSALRQIPYGETRSYGQIARSIGSSARAVGRANATNPVCVVVPCHRVIGADGSLTGYAFGEAKKRSLLRLEGAGFTRS